MSTRIGKNAHDGYIFYNNLGEFGNEAYWTQISNGAHSYFSKVELLTQPNFQTAAHLYSMGLAELEKEKVLLAEYFGVASLNWDESNYREIIEALNEALNIAKVFQRVVQRVQEDDKKAGLRGTNIASTYGSYLMTRLNRDIPFFFNNFLTIKQITEGKTEEFGRRFDTMIRKAMDGALDKMLSAKSDPNIGDNEQIWLEALSAINHIEDFRNRFGIEFFSRYGFNSIRDRIKRDIANGIDVVKLKNKITQEYKQEIKGKLDLQTIAGYVAEQLGQAFQAAGLGGDIKWSSNLTGKNSAFTTDAMTVLGDANVNFDEFVASTKIDANHELSNFYNKVIKGLDNVTVIYENTKKYNLGKNFSGFSGGTRKLDGINEILNYIGYGHAEAFINKIKQTMPGAIYDGTNYQQQAADTLAYAVAYFLFDDMETIGSADGGNKVIHIFRLSDVVLPLSFLLIKLAEAMRDAEQNINSYVKVSFNLPLQPNYNYPQEDRSREASEERWESQRVIGQSSTVTINFLSNFKSILQDFF